MFTTKIEVFYLSFRRHTPLPTPNGAWKISRRRTTELSHELLVMEDGRGSSLATGSGDSDRYEVVGDIDADSPKDKKSLVLVMMTLCGAGFLFPFNSYIGAVDFLEERYPSFSPEFVIPFVRESTVSFFFSFFSSLSHFYLFSLFGNVVR